MQRWVLMLAALMWMGCGWARAGERFRFKWEDLDSRITNKKVAFVLPDGTHVEGKVIGVEPDGLRLKVSKSSNRNTQPKGRHLIARQAISVLRVTEYRRMGRLLATAGAIATAAGIAAAKYPDLYEGPTVIIVPAVVAGGIAGSAIGGYYAGKALDKKVTEIRVLPSSDE